MATELLNRRVVRVPDVVGRSLTKAQILLEDSGLKQPDGGQQSTAS